MDKEEKRKRMLVKKGYFTVNGLVEELQKLQQQGYGEELVGSDFEHYKYCEYGKNEHYVVVC